MKLRGFPLNHHCLLLWLIILPYCAFTQNPLKLSNDTNAHTIISSISQNGNEVLIPLFQHHLSTDIRTSLILSFNSMDKSLDTHNYTPSYIGNEYFIPYITPIDNRFLCFGSSFDSSKAQDLYLLELDQQYNTVWDTLIHGAYPDEYFTSFYHADSAVFLISNCMDYDSAEGELVIWKYQDRQITRKYSYPHPPIFWTDMVINTLSNEVIVKQQPGPRLVLSYPDFVLDSASWIHQTYVNYFPAPDIHTLPSGNYQELTAIETQYSTFEHPEWEVALCTVDKYGSILNSVRLASPASGTDIMYPRSSITIDSDTIVTAVFHTEYFQDEITYFPYPLGYNYESSIKVFSHNNQGSVVWNKSISLGSTLYPVEIIETSQNTYILVFLQETSEPDEPYTSTPYLIEIAKDGSIIFLEEEESIPGSIQIFPNPANNWITITSDNGNMNSTISELHIWSIEGKLIRSKSFARNKSHIELDIHDIPSGAYLMQMVRADGHIVVIKLIVR